MCRSQSARSVPCSAARARRRCASWRPAGAAGRPSAGRCAPGAVRWRAACTGTRPTRSRATPGATTPQ
eukprot:2390148-Pyramimonas_sp.AAC.2